MKNIDWRTIATFAFICGVVVMLTSCTSTENILAGSTHACGTIHAEGYFTDTQGEIIVVKAPEDWTAEQVKAFCAGN